VQKKKTLIKKKTSILMEEEGGTDRLRLMLQEWRQKVGNNPEQFTEIYERDSADQSSMRSGMSRITSK